MTVGSGEASFSEISAASECLAAFLNTAHVCHDFQIGCACHVHIWKQSDLSDIGKSKAFARIDERRYDSWVSRRGHRSSGLARGVASMLGNHVRNAIGSRLNERWACLEAADLGRLVTTLSGVVTCLGRCGRCSMGYVETVATIDVGYVAKRCWRPSCGC